jgi:hypothetical protein
MILMETKSVLPFIARKKWFAPVTFFIILSLLNLAIGCRNYYKVNTVRPPAAHSENKFTELKNENRYFIVHFANEAWHLDNLFITEDETALNGIIFNLPDNRKHFLKTDPAGVNRYRPHEKNVLQEVHVYINEYIDLGSSQISIPLTSINKIEVYDLAQGATVASWALGAASVILGALTVLYIIVLLTKDSCPFIYEYNGEQYVFAGEIFSGAIMPYLERQDYLPLYNMQPLDDHYLLRVTNEVKEIQYINQLQLNIIDHPASVKVMIDKYGALQTLANPLPPIAAHTFSGADLLPLILEKDDVAYYCNEAISTDTAIEGMILEFDKPRDASAAKLAIRAKNSFWIEHVMAEFHQLFGSRYDAFQEKQQKNPPAIPHQWMLNQNLPVSVYIENNGQWVFHDYYNIAGPMAMKDDVLSIDVSSVAGDKVRIKLETGFLFWEFDYVAIDYSEDIPLQVVTVAATEAIDEMGNDVSKLIAADDQQYYVQPYPGNEAMVKFPFPALSNEARSIILHSKGHYKILKDQKGRAEVKTLKTFRQAGRLPEFSKELYQRRMGVTLN